MSTTSQEYEQALACFGGAVGQMDFDIKCARQSIEATARSIIHIAAQLVEMAKNGEHADSLAHYASVIVGDAKQLSEVAQYAKGISAAQARLRV